MIKTNQFVRSICCAIFVIASLVALPVHAQVKKDSTKKLLLARLSKKEMPAIVIKEANVVYPDLLCGNEEQSLDYIEKFSTNRRDYLIRTYNKGKKFFPKAATILAKNNIPDEFKVLLALESAFNGNAVSRAGAVGYWQIMDEVAKEYGLKYARNMSAAQRKKELRLAQALAKKQHKKFRAPVIRDDRKNFDKSTYW
jgi:membrane-bound lytic murein transglycosylase D